MPPIASGSAVFTACAKRRSIASSPGRRPAATFGAMSTSARPSGDTQSREISGGKVARVISVGCSSVGELRKRDLQRAGHRGFGAVARGGVGERRAFAASPTDAGLRRRPDPDGPRRRATSWFAARFNAATRTASLDGGAGCLRQRGQQLLRGAIDQHKLLRLIGRE